MKSGAGKGCPGQGKAGQGRARQGRSDERREVGALLIRSTTSIRSKCRVRGSVPFCHSLPFLFLWIFTFSRPCFGHLGLTLTGQQPCLLFPLREAVMSALQHYKYIQSVSTYHTALYHPLLDVVSFGAAALSRLMIFLVIISTTPAAAISR